VLTMTAPGRGFRFQEPLHPGTACKRSLIKILIKPAGCYRSSPGKPSQGGMASLSLDVGSDGKYFVES
jgi:hypothetical protein